MAVFFYRCQLGHFAGYREGSFPLNDTVCPGCGLLLLPVPPPTPQATASGASGPAVEKTATVPRSQTPSREPVTGPVEPQAGTVTECKLPSAGGLAVTGALGLIAVILGVCLGRYGALPGAWNLLILSLVLIGNCAFLVSLFVLWHVQLGKRTSKARLTQRALSTSSSHGVLACVLFGAFVISTVVPFGALHSCMLGWRKGYTVCAYRGCFEPAEDHVKYYDSETREEFRTVGYCKVHVGHAPRWGTGTETTGSPGLGSLVGIAFLGFYVYRFIVTLRSRVEPSSAAKGGSLKRFALLTAAGVLGLNAFLWVWTRYLCGT
jgi:hypothetical protein